jgi:multicomponent Na+:H+ antiporter subunit F
MTAEATLPMFDTFNTILILFVIAAFALTAVRLVKGPSYADRFVSIDMLTGLGVAACALTALATGRSEFLDVAFALALIAFVATAAFAAFLERKVAVTNRRLAQDSTRRPRMTPKGEVTQ